MRKSVVLVLILVLAGPVWASPAWYEHYDQGLRLIQDGDAEGALSELRLAVEDAPDPLLMAPTAGPRYVDYLPYLYLAVASHMTGDVAAANDYLARSEAAGEAAKSEAGSSLLESYRILLGRESEAAAATSGTSYRDFEPQAVVLTEREFEETREAVATRCGLQLAGEYGAAPWYFHYELGLELARKGDPQRALDSLVYATGERRDPKRSARMYGMWFIDYMPYFEIAKVHAELGNWDCARDALRLSEHKGEITRENEEYDDYRTLRDEVSARVAQR